MTRLYGWYDNPTQKVPAEDLDLPSPCPVCRKTIRHAGECRTVNLMSLETPVPERSYFYFIHRTCHDKSSEAADEIILAAIEANGD